MVCGLFGRIGSLISAFGEVKFVDLVKCHNQDLRLLSQYSVNITF